MILVDTSVWIDHLQRGDAMLVDALTADQVATHPLVIEELALGSIAQREAVLASLRRLSRVVVASHVEISEFVEARRLWGRGLSAVDVHLLASTVLTAGASLWTRDRRLRAAADEHRVNLAPWD